MRTGEDPPTRLDNQDLRVLLDAGYVERLNRDRDAGPWGWYIGLRVAFVLALGWLAYLLISWDL